MKYGYYYGKIKTEFGMFGNILDKTNKKIQELSNIVETASVRTRSITSKLKNVEALPSSEDVILIKESVDEDIS
ncbi:MAG: hypothetical protein RSE41_01265 [Clostridia bacterium]